jgi:hypothetical protein
MEHDATDDPLRSMVVDRVVRDDGRYLIYYDWPDAVADEAAVRGTADPAAEADGGPADV